MTIPKSVSGKRNIVSSGKRLNSKPTYIVASILFATLFGIYYAANNRAQGPRIADSQGGEEMLRVDAVPSSKIEFLQDRPDGLAGVNRDLFESRNSDENGRVSNLDDRMMDAYEARQLIQAEAQNALRERMIARQIEQAQAAIEGDMAVGGFDSNSAFALGRPPKPVDQYPNYTEVSASSAAGQFMGQPVGAGSLENLSPQDLQRISASLPPEYKKILQELLQGGAVGPQQPAPGSTDPAGVVASDRHLNNNQRDFTLREKVTPPRTRFEIKTGTILPSAMISAANSDLPGDIVGQITQNVYDTQTGKHLLIPQGTKLFGRYDAFTQLGQERLLIVWDRLIFPDAETLDIGGMQGYDGFGQSGVTDQVNNHFVRTLFNAFLISVVDASGEAISESASNIDNSFVLNLTSSFGETAGQPFDEYLRNRLRIKPTLSIRSGFRFNVMVSKDISLDAPYRYGYKLKLARP